MIDYQIECLAFLDHAEFGTRAGFDAGRPALQRLHLDRKQAITLFEFLRVAGLLGDARFEIALRENTDVAEPEPNLQTDQYDRADRGEDPNRVQLRNSARPR